MPQSLPLFASTLFLVLLLCTCSGPEDQGATTATDTPPNIIYILADDLGYGDVGAFNPKSAIPTPSIDALAAAGMTFTDAHSSSAVCTPTRYGILTGRYSWRGPLKQGVLTGKSKALIEKDRTTVAGLLKKAGYQTAVIGKWHLGWGWGLKDTTTFVDSGWNASDFDNLDFTKPVENTPITNGFDYAYALCGSLDMAPYAYVENGTITAPVITSTVDTGKYTWWREGPTANDFTHEDVTPNFFRRAMKYVTEAAATEDPFFLYLPLPSPHTPILPTEEWLGKSGVNPYADFIMMVDHYVGQLTQTLEAQGIAENTLVIFTSDNGASPQADFDVLRAKGHAPSHIYRGHKADIFEGGHRIPFIAKWPAKIAAGSVSEQTISLTDLMATCAAITETELAANEGEDSYSLLPLFDPATASAYEREATVHHSINGSFALRKDNYKLIFCPGSGGWSAPKPNAPGTSDLPPFQLYDMAKNPGETENLYASNPVKVVELKALMTSYINNGRSTPGAKQLNASLNRKGKVWTQIEPILVD